MPKKTIVVLVIAMLIIGLAAACGSKPTVQKIGDIEIEMLEPASLKDKSLQQWYEDSYRVRFSHDVSHIDGYKYVLICAGEMPTGGYSIALTKAVQENGELLFSARLVRPEEGAKVSQASTYPHVLFRIKETSEVAVRIVLDLGGAGENESLSPDRYSNISGVYIGQADRNFAEILIDQTINFPGNEKPVVFKLTADVELVPNDRVNLDCFRNEQGQWEIARIEKVSGDESAATARGEYVGQIDANSVEIVINGNPLAFRLSDQVKLMTDLEGIDEGTPVEISYIKDGSSLKITELSINPKGEESAKG